MATDSFEFDPVPGYTKPTHTYGDEFGDEFHAPNVAELLNSYARFTQRGVTLAGGQGIIKGGTVLAQHTATGKYVKYNATGSGGDNVALGVLRDTRDTGGGNSPSSVAKDCLGNLVISGILNLNLVSGTDTASQVGGAAGGIGSGSTGVVTVLNARVDAVNNLFVF